MKKHPMPDAVSCYADARGGSAGRNSAALFAVVALFNACDSSSRAVAPTDQARDSRSAGGAITLVERPQEREQLRIAQDIPGFGGYFFDKTGQLVIRVSKQELANAATSRVKWSRFFERDG